MATAKTPKKGAGATAPGTVRKTAAGGRSTGAASTPGRARRSTPRKKTAARARAEQPLAELLAGLQDTYARLHRDGRAHEEKLVTLMGALEETLREVARNSASRDAQQDEALVDVTRGIAEGFERFREEQGSLERNQAQALAALSGHLDHSIAALSAYNDRRERIDYRQERARERSYERDLRRARLWGLPGLLVAVVVAALLFYVVWSMDRAMSSMARDMREIRGAIASVAADMNGMSTSVRSVAGDLGEVSRDTRSIARNMGSMTHNVNGMSQNVTPVMYGLRAFMPWAP